VAVLLDSPDKYGEALQLLDYGPSAFERKVYAKKGDVLDRIPVQHGRKRQVAAVCADTLSGVAGLGPSEDTRLELDRKRLTAPVARGAVVGEAHLVAGGEVVARSPLVAREAVPVSRLVVCWWWTWRVGIALAVMAVMVRVSAKAIKAHRRGRPRLPPQV
jgi:D-alanyl-D-alanine carboxypeptidase (penicillin-binding protein 5/6)